MTPKIKMLNRPLPPVHLGRNFSLPLSFSEPLAQPLFDVQAPLAFVSPWFSWPLPPASAPQPRSHLCASLAPLPPAWQPVPQLSWLLLLQLTFLLVLSVVLISVFLAQPFSPPLLFALPWLLNHHRYWNYLMMGFSFFLFYFSFCLLTLSGFCLYCVCLTPKILLP